jgi:hypothetical protein
MLRSSWCFLLDRETFGQLVVSRLPYIPTTPATITNFCRFEGRVSFTVIDITMCSWIHGQELRVILLLKALHETYTEHAQDYSFT